MLSMEQLQAIQLLQMKCEAHDSISLKLNWDMLRTRENDELDIFLYEDGLLVGFLGLYPFASTVEVCGMVKPSERRKGHFSRIFRQGMDKIRELGFEKVLLNAPAGSESARKFLAKIGASYAFSEHQMEWESRPLEEMRQVELRPAVPGDAELRARLNVEAFKMSEEDARTMENEFDRTGGSDILMIEAGGDTVGKIRVSREEGEAWLYGFCIVPERQGQGIGRSALTKIVEALSLEGYSVHLEVEAKNDNALGLYTSVGFRAVHSQDYYHWPIDQ